MKPSVGRIVQLAHYDTREEKPLWEAAIVVEVKDDGFEAVFFPKISDFVRFHPSLVGKRMIDTQWQSFEGENLTWRWPPRER